MHTEGDDMIESLNGIYETVNYKQSTSIKLYENDDFEDYPPHWHTTPEIIMPTENSYTVECYNEIFPFGYIQTLQLRVHIPIGNNALNRAV